MIETELNQYFFANQAYEGELNYSVWVIVNIDPLLYALELVRDLSKHDAEAMAERLNENWRRVMSRESL